MSAGIPAHAPGRPSAPGPPPAVPDHQILRCIGVGSYGEVWLARNVLGQPRAVKVIRRHFFRDARPFERELAGVRRFEPLSREHEGFVDILHTGHHDADGYFYYVMELADPASGGPARGADLADYQPRTLARLLHEHGALPVAECLAMGRRLAGALGCLHRHGLIHRDVKPSNIIFVGGQPRLADVGLVVEMSEARSFVGTDGYIPPEGPNHPQADIFALGKVLYEAGMGWDRLDFPRPGDRLGRGVEGEALRELNALVLKACAAHRDARYRSVAELAADIECIQAGGSLRRRLEWRRWRRVGARVGAVGLGLGAAVGAGLWLRSRGVQLEATEKTAQSLRVQAARRTASAHNAEGTRLLARHDLSGAALHFAAALPAASDDALAGRIQRVRIHQALEGSARLTALWAAGGAVTSADYSPDGRRLATLDAQGKLAVWDAAAGTRLLGPLACGPGALRVRYSLDGTRLLVDSARGAGGLVRLNEPLGAIQVLDAATGERRLPADWPAGPGLLDPAGRRAVVFGGGRRWEVREVATGKLVEQAEPGEGELRLAAFSPDGGQVAVAHAAGGLAVFRPGEGQGGRRQTVVGGEIRNLALAGTTGRLVVEFGDAWRGSLVQTWQLHPLRPLGEPVTLPEESLGLQGQIHGDQCFLLAEGSLGISLRSVDGGELLLPQRLLGAGPPTGWAVSPDGLLLASGELDGTARLWNLETGRRVASSLHHGGAIRALRFSPDGTRVMTAGDDGLVKVWDFARRVGVRPVLTVTGKWKHVPLGPIDFPAATSPDDRWMVAASTEGDRSVIEPLDLARWSVTPVAPAPPESEAGQVVWSHRRDLWASFDSVHGLWRSTHAAVLWQPGQGSWRPTVLTHPSMVTAAAFTADDARLVTRDRDGQLRVWLTRDGSLESLSAQVEQGSPWSPISAEARWLVAQAVPAGELRFLGWTGAGDWRFGGAAVAGKSLIGGAFNPGSTAFAAVFVDRSVKLWNPANGAELPFPPGQIPPAQAIRWSADGRTLVTLDDQAPAHRVDLTGPSVANLGGKTWERPLALASFAWDDRLVAVADTEGWVWVVEARTGDWVIPPRRHAGTVRHVHLGASGQLVTLSDPDRVQGWILSDVVPAPDRLDLRARLQSGRQLGSRESLEPVPAGRLLEGWAQWRQLPEATEPDEAGRTQEWFLDQFGDLSSLPQSRAAAFHAARWAQANPGAPGLAEWQARIARASLPARDRSAPATALDLSAYYTHALEDLRVDAGPGMPPGLRRMAGKWFDARGVVRLEEAGFAQRQRHRGGAHPTSLPRTRVLGLPVQQACRALVLLHGAEFPQGGQLRYGKFVVLLEDGTRHGFDPASPERLGSVRIQGDRKVLPEYLRPPRPENTPTPALVQSRWENPTPQVPVRCVEFQLQEPGTRPFLVAITVE